MNFTEENALKFHHYCSSLTEAMRPILHTKKFSEVDQDYWNKSLKEFLVIIQNILSDGLEVGFMEVDESFIKKVHYKIFGNVLNAMLPLNYSHLNSKESIKNTIEVCNLIAKDCIRELYRVQL